MFFLLNIFAFFVLAFLLIFKFCPEICSSPFQLEEFQHFHIKVLAWVFTKVMASAEELKRA
jgi:hypothetical protein